ncbi:hypothetical protein [Silvimonas amylolytica]|uniref:C2H2-type domain-containing protein n=1 Tax=Silvimonas amylolytica TaxID=449663 RepID=A0ABQ2PIH8_9NEIS|nr:hypothetical protein [Silvimonas amylolytica]GGP25385.1 hypothetical protein GCM10010971_12040 [Silvimonas amylolytica]
MTHRATDPNGHGIQSAEWFRQTYGENATGRCEICEAELVLRVAHPPHTMTHFAHKAGSRCSSLEQYRHAVFNLKPSALDLENGKRLRAWALKELYPIYLKAYSLSGRKLAWGDFQRALIDANTRGIFDYAGLQAHYLPYLLLCLYPERFHDKTTYDAIDAYFVLPAGMKHLDDLWNKPGEVKQTIWKVSHITRQSRRGAPKAVEMFTEVEAIAMDDAPFYIPAWVASAQAKLEPLLAF